MDTIDYKMAQVGLAKGMMMLKLSCVAVLVLVVSVISTLGAAADTGATLRQHQQEQLDKVVNAD